MKDYYDEGSLTKADRRMITWTILAISLLFAWWMRTELGLVLLSVAVGGSISIGLWAYWLLVDADQRDEEEYYGWTEDDLYD